MQIHLAKMNYKDKDATINPARHEDDTGADSETAPSIQL